MNSEKFIEEVLKKSNKNYVICPPPIDAQCALNILIKHLLGENWYVTIPLSQEQVNAEAVYEIIKKYPEKLSLKNLFFLK